MSKELNRKEEISKNLVIYLTNICQEAQRYSSPIAVFFDLMETICIHAQLMGMTDKDFKFHQDQHFSIFKQTKLSDEWIELFYRYQGSVDTDD